MLTSLAYQGTSKNRRSLIRKSLLAHVNRDYRLGWSLTQPDDGESFAFSLDVTRRESANNEGAAPEHGVQLELNTRF